MYARILIAGTLLAAGTVSAQSALQDVLAGKLVKPEVGVWAWYEIDDPATDEKVQLRQAITAEERVKRKDGFWVETLIRPQVGFPVVYKMLLTGPATDPGNVHAVYYQAGTEPPVEVPLDELEVQAEPTEIEQLEPLEEVNMPTPQGNILCRHYKLADGTEVWTSDELPPLGIVRLQSDKGNMVLQRYGKGGPDAAAQLRAPGEPSGQETEAPQDSAEPQEEREKPAPVRRNFGGRRP
ncbi:MAG: hypothetical protein GC168_05515 [Candidatus Hydrogenedens sp.]|nr:hypothetical protein [Candidatus Hydrogenedens sp.]